MTGELDRVRPAAVTFAKTCADQLATKLAAVVDARVLYRVKTPDAVRHKLARRSDSRINDFIGLRVIVGHIGDIAAARAAIESYAGEAGLEVVDEEDRLLRPGIGGYRAVHVDYVLRDPAAAGLGGDVGVEVQITSEVLAAHAEVCHRVVYRRDTPADPKLAAELERLGRCAMELDTGLADVASSTD